MKIAIIGGGPIGVEAALYGACAGHDVQLFERGTLAANVRAWGFVRVFTEWGRNRSPLACRLLVGRGIVLPPDEETSSGHELAEYVESLASLEPLRGRIHLQTEVAALTRDACLKSDFIDDASRRAPFPFRLLLRDSSGERLEQFDAVLDATGVYATPNFAGSGGAPCPGETGLHHRIDYALPDVLGSQRARFADKHTLVIGSGHSAASTLLAVADLMAHHPQTRLTWIVRRDVPEHGRPYTLNVKDDSPNRQKLQGRANELIDHDGIDFRPRTVLQSLSHDGNAFHVVLSESGGIQSLIECDNVVAHTGFRPDSALWSELQVPVHPATGGPQALSVALLESNRRAGVGLSTGYAEKQRNADKLDEATKPEAEAEHKGKDPRVASPDLLRLPEPNFFVIGIKSYGRDAGFLMHNGFRQVRDVYKLLSNDANYDLYEGALD